MVKHKIGLKIQMCGDHPSFITTNPDKKSKDDKSELETIREKDKKIVSFHNISPCTSKSDRVGRTGPEQVMREHSKRPLECVQLADIDTALPGANRSLVHATAGSARWAPHAVVVLALALLVTHALHALAAALQAALPPLRKLCQYCRKWTEEAWREQRDYNRRLYPIGLALLTALLYSLYFTLYVIYCVNIWAIEPLYQDDRDDRSSSYDITDVKVTNYEDIPPRSAKRE